MFRLKCLTCCGCQTKSINDIFFDNDKKRPLFIACGHSLCSGCLQEFSECPICNKTIEQRENYTARAVYESFTSDPVTVFKSWFYAQVDGQESCSGCYEMSKNLRLCITCESALDHLYTETISNDGSPWEDYGQVAYYEKFRKQGRNSYWTEKPLDKHTTRLRFRTVFYILSNRLNCSDCILNEHDEHVSKTLNQLEYSEVELKQSSSFIASNFLWNTLKEWNAKCLLRKMNMLRICEKLEHLAFHWYPNPNQLISRKEINIMNPSKVNKFFESLNYENGKIIPSEEGGEMITLLEKAVKSLNVNEDCECQETWNQMHRLHFGNQIEKYFVEAIEKMDDVSLSKCSLSNSEINAMQKKANEFSKTKLFEIYRAFCWNYESNKLCCMFDNDDRKPCICPHCKVSTCKDCLRSYSHLCSFCGRSFFEYNKIREYTIDDGVLDLIVFYKNNCVELFEKWWMCDVSELEFCLSCSSYSNQLEVCVFCELQRSRQKTALTTKPNRIGSSYYRQEMKLYFDFDGLALFPMRWQCAHCIRRLESDWMHKKCNDPKYDNWKGTWNRGCNHLINRVYNRKRCCGYNARADYHEYNALLLKDIDGYDTAMKVSSMGLVLRIVKAGIIERIRCKLWKIRMLKIYGCLNGQVYYYFKNLLNGKRPEKLRAAALSINFLIDQLKKEWDNYNQKFAEQICECANVWNNADNVARGLLKKVTNYQMSHIIDTCPLHLDHGIVFL